ncbi:MAG: ATP-binding cassette domain-containing protein [Oscillochloris sp.]|nr:ATP-binding cassette domain-containing protein [Oscillochloris sp.]
MPLIEVEHLRKTFIRAERRPGMLGAFQSLFARSGHEIIAVDDVSFQIAAGEMVGYLGPNGAGKSTTLKMLTGILTPTAGRIAVGGIMPHRRRVDHVKRIGVVFGQRTQLWWDLPTIDSFELLRHVYRIPLDRYRENVRIFGKLLDLEPFLNTPVRQLSLGQRMRADLTAALLHDPTILFLDEPTIGLDVVARERIREFLLEVNRKRGMTIVLTSHDLADITRLCPRVVLIDCGRVIYDGALEELRRRHGRRRTLVVDLADSAQLPTVPGVALLRREGLRIWLGFDRDTISAADLIATVAAQCPLRDLSVEEPEVEAVLRAIYQGAAVDLVPA